MQLKKKTIKEKNTGEMLLRHVLSYHTPSCVSLHECTHLDCTGIIIINVYTSLQIKLEENLVKLQHYNNSIAQRVSKCLF